MNRAAIRGAVASLRGGFHFIRGVVVRFYADHCLRHASALAYATLLSLVPLLALMFAVLKGLGVQWQLEKVLLSRLALDPETVRQVIVYIDRTNVSTLGALGAVFLVGTVISVLGSVESSFNEIWRVHKNRSVWRKAADFISARMLVPFLLLAAVAITSSAKSQALLELLLATDYVGDVVVVGMRLLPIVINAIAIGMMYSIMPNRRPHFPSVLFGAAIAGTLWQLVQWSYVTLQVGFARYNAIYGALSQLPITLVWIYVSWVVILAGAECAAVYEYGVEDAESAGQPYSRWAIAVHILLRLADRFRADGGALEANAAAHELAADGALVREVAACLCASGMIVETDSEGCGYVLARDPRLIDLGQLLPILEPTRAPRGADPRVEKIRALFDEEMNATDHDHSLATLHERSRSVTAKR